MSSFDPPRTPLNPPHLEGVQALRGIAALLVVLVHYGTAAVAKGFGWSGLDRIEMGHAGVDIFFVVSGFIMEYTAGGNADRRGFLLRRALRILPLYWTLTLIAYALIVLAPGFLARAAGPDHFVLSMLLLPGLSPNGNGWYVIGMAWSLSYELWFYIVFAALMPFSARIRLISLATVFAGTIVLGLVLDPASPIARIACDAIAIEFLAGVAVAMRYRGGLRWPRSLAIAIAVVSAVALIARFDAYAADGFPRLALWGLPAMGIVFAVVLGEWHAAGSAGRILAWLGDRSYSLYLSHFFAIAAFGHLYARASVPLPAALCAVVCLGMALGLAEICYRTIEVPARRVLASRQHPRPNALVST